MLLGAEKQAVVGVVSGGSDQGGGCGGGWGLAGMRVNFGCGGETEIHNGLDVGVEDRSQG